jgi:hypothetical protein
LALLAAPGFAPAGEKPADYLPLKKGNKWHFKMEVMGQKIDVVQEVSKIENVDGKPVAEVETQINGQKMATEQLSSTDKGVFRHSFNNERVSPPVHILKLPASKGDKWDSEFELMGQKIKAACALDFDEVTVPAGKYKATTVNVETEVQGVRIHTKYWFAPNVGIVKQTFDLNGVVGSMELEKVELAK